MSDIVRYKTVNTMSSFEKGGENNDNIVRFAPLNFFDWRKLELGDLVQNIAQLKNKESSDSEAFDLENFKFYLTTLVNNSDIPYHHLNKLLAFAFLQKLKKYEGIFPNSKELVLFVAFIFISEVEKMLSEPNLFFDKPDEMSLRYWKVLSEGFLRIDCEDSVVCATNVFNLLNNQVIQFIYDSTKTEASDFAHFAKDKIKGELIEKEAFEMLKKSRKLKEQNNTASNVINLPQKHGKKPTVSTKGADIIPFPKKPERD